MDSDIIFCILEQLTFFDIITCTLVNKQFNHISKNELLWKKMSERDYPDEIDSKYEQNYRGHYRLCKFLDCRKLNWQLMIDSTKDRKCLDISCMGLKSIPSEIGLMTDMKRLCLHRNKLRSLPVELSQLTNLVRLDIDNNKLDSLPSDLSVLTNLQILYIDPSQREIIPSSLEYAVYWTHRYYDKIEFSP
jgi:hypothetical protein